MPRRAVYALAGAAAAVGLLVLTWFLAFHGGPFHHADARILAGFSDLSRPRVDPIASFIAHLCNPQPFVYLGGAVVLVALIRRRFGVALVIGLILLGANVTTQLLKPLLAAPRSLPGEIQLGAVSWPSGHATAAMSLALCAVLAAPARARAAVAALGAAFAVAVSYSFMTLGWHYPSDVLGGYLVATAWALVGIAVLLTVRRRAPAEFGFELGVELTERRSLGRTLRAPAAALLTAVLLALLLFLVRPHQVVSYAEAHRVFVIGAAAIAAMGLGLATGVMLALRR